MSTGTRILLLVAVVLAVLVALWVVLAQNCPNAGLALTGRARNLHLLKNRTALPQESEIDVGITLDALIQLGDDTNRWSTNRAARIQGHVISVAYARAEAANCFSPCRRDIHIHIAKRDGAAKNQHLVLEVTPGFRDWAKERGMDWSEENLQRQLVGRWCEFEGWLYFDVGHTDQAENTAANNPANWRATAWEVHPVTKITVIR